MLTKPYALAFYHKFSKAPQGWLKRNQSLITRAIELVRKNEGDEEAETLKNLISLAEIWEKSN